MKLLSTILLLLIFAIPAWAQDGPQASLGVHFTAAKRGGNPTDDVGVNGSVGYAYKGFAANAELFGNDGFASRFRTGATYTVKHDEFAFDLGGGYFCFARCRGNLDGAYAHAGVSYERIYAFGRVGDSRFLEGEVSGDVWKINDHLGVNAFIRGTRHEVTPNFTQSIYQAGLRLNLK